MAKGESIPRKNAGIKKRIREEIKGPEEIVNSFDNGESKTIPNICIKIIMSPDMKIIE